MNIYLTSKNPINCAEALDNETLDKAINDIVSMLSTACYSYWPAYARNKDIFLVEFKELSNPCISWLRAQKNHYIWGVGYFGMLLQEYYYRNNNRHAKAKAFPILIEPVSHHLIAFPENIKFFNNSKVHPSTGDIFEDYKIFLSIKWLTNIEKPKWFFRDKPDWIYSKEDIKKYKILNS